MKGALPTREEIKAFHGATIRPDNELNPELASPDFESVPWPRLISRAAYQQDYSSLFLCNR